MNEKERIQNIQNWGVVKVEEFIKLEFSFV